MPDRQPVTEEIVQAIERLKERLEAENPDQKISVYQRVRQVQLSVDREASMLQNHEWDEGHHENEVVQFERLPSVMELLEFMADYPLKDQVYMVCNLLTISGFSQAEIAEALGVSHKTYRNSLWQIRKSASKDRAEKPPLY